MRIFRQAAFAFLCVAYWMNPPALAAAAAPCDAITGACMAGGADPAGAAEDACNAEMCWDTCSETNSRPDRIAMGCGSYTDYDWSSACGEGHFAFTHPENGDTYCSEGACGCRSFLPV